MERKFTDDEIVKVLGCCESANCFGCPLDGEVDCVHKSAQVALDLIKRQKAEIADERARKELCAEVIKRLDKEIETARSEAIKEFADRLKEKLQLNRTVMGYSGAFVESVQLDNLVKEMTEEKK